MSPIVVTGYSATAAADRRTAFANDDDDDDSAGTRVSPAFSSRMTCVAATPAPVHPIVQLFHNYAEQKAPNRWSRSARRKVTSSATTIGA